MIINHPRLPNNSIATTSYIESLAVSEESGISGELGASGGDNLSFTAITYSGTLYSLRLSEMNLSDEAFKVSMDYINSQISTNDSIYSEINRIKTTHDERIAAELERASDKLDDGEMLVSMNNIEVISAFFKEAGVVKECVHYTGECFEWKNAKRSVMWVGSDVELRVREYQEGGLSVYGVYLWGSSINKLKVINLGCKEMVFTDVDGELTIKPGTLGTILKK